MKKLEEAITCLIKNKYGSLAAFAKKIDVPYSSVYSALQRGLDNTRTELTNKIYRELNIDWDSTSGDDFSKLQIKSKSKYVTVPLFGSIAAGTPIDMEHADEEFFAPAPLIERHPNAFFLKVEGTSMDMVLPDGCYALIDPDIKDPRYGAACAVIVNGNQATIKRVIRLANGYELRPDSKDPTHHSIILDKSDEDAPEVRILGEVVWYVLPFDWEI